MREIRFRAWNKDKKKIFDVESLVMPKYNLKGVVSDISECCYSFEDVEIMQYTGLKDKNGKPIYEGDIVKSKSHKPENYEISFIEGGFCATIGKEWQLDINHFYDSTGCMIEVIGNIYQDSHLLEGR